MYEYFYFYDLLNFYLTIVFLKTKKKSINSFLFLDDTALRENCTHTEECAVKNSKCIGDCRCDINHVISANNSMCLKSANSIGDPCEEDLQCQDINYSRCHRGKCSCLKGYHRRSNTCHLDIGEEIQLSSNSFLSRFLYMKISSKFLLFRKSLKIKVLQVKNLFKKILKSKISKIKIH